MRNTIVIGAGVAGLIAAVTLAEAGHAVTVLEASDRVGGRVRTEYVDGMPVELGAEFVHGKPPELLSLLEELGLSSYELEGTDFSYARDGGVQPQEDAGSDEGADAAQNGPFAVLDQMERWADAHANEDLTFAAWLAQQTVSAVDAASATGYVEGFNAADAREISVQSLALQQKAENAIEGDVSSHVRDGYDRLPLALAERLKRAGGVIRPGRRVTRIAWTRGKVQCWCDEELCSGERAIVALPLGVLQNDSVCFEPQPGSILRDVMRMRMGQVCRINLVFKRRWWAELPHAEHERLAEMSFLFGRERSSEGGLHLPVFWTGFPSLDPVLTAWIGGPSSEAFALLDDHAVAHIACGDLARIFGLSQEAVLGELRSHHMHDWKRDPLSCGAYSWVPAGAVDASARMAEPVENTLFFAGEHTDITGHWGTVHGALRSGMRAAGQVLAVCG